MRPTDVLRTFCHVADLANAALTWDLSQQWSVRIGQEAVEQSAEERRLGYALPPSATLVPYTDEELAARQLVFTDDWVRPLYNVAAILFPGAKSRLAQIERNREACKSLMVEARTNSESFVRSRFAYAPGAHDGPAPPTSVLGAK